MNVVVMGHVDHGKSTLIGRLLYDSEQIADGRMSELQRIAEEMKKKFEFAYFIDAFGDEISEERTIDTTQIRFKSPRRTYTIIDVPGHKEFIKNMLTGASRADVAVLVVSAEGIGEQTKRHLFLADLLGIHTLLVFINKMDLFNHDELVANKIRLEVENLCRHMRFTYKKYINGSALNGINVCKGDRPLVACLDELKGTQTDLPMRLIIQGMFNSYHVGSVISGTIRSGEVLKFEPAGVQARIYEMSRAGKKIEEAKCGESIGLALGCNEVKRGDVGGHLNTPPTHCESAKVEFTLTAGSVSVEDLLYLKCGAKKVICGVDVIESRISTLDGSLQEHYPKQIRTNGTAIARFKLEPIVLEEFSEMPELGRFALSSGGRAIGLGIVLEVE